MKALPEDRDICSEVYQYDTAVRGEGTQKQDSAVSGTLRTR